MFLVLPYEAETEIRRRPIATISLVGLNFLVFLATLLSGAEGREIIFLRYGFAPEQWTRLETFVTYMFLHGGWLHILGNMYFLWVFGRILEDRLGRVRYLALYLAAGVLACVAHAVTAHGFLSDVPCVGASGAVSGMLGASLIAAGLIKLKCFYVWMPGLRPLLGSFRVPAAAFLGVWFVGQLVYALTFSELDAAVEVAYWAHIGGFVFGAAAVAPQGLLRRVRSLYGAHRRRRAWAGAMAAWRRRELDRAAAALEALRGGGDGGPEVELALARLRLEQGQTPEVLALGKAALKSALARKDRARSIESYYLLAAAGHGRAADARDSLAVARSLAGRGRRGEAEEVVLDALRREPENDVADAMLYELADLSMRRGDRAQAREIFGLLSALYPDSRLTSSARWRLRELGSATRS